MKKMFVFFNVMLLFVFIACGNAAKTGVVPEKTVNRGKTLIAYFSYSGNTEELAKIIQQSTSGDMFKIATAEAYPTDNDKLSKQAQQEQEDDYIPALAAKIDNFEQYDTIFIGYPIWQGTFPQPVAAFLKEYDFAGKKIVPFATYGGSGLGETAERIQKLAPDATVFEALGVRTPNVSKSQNTVQNWLVKIGITQ